MGFDILSAFESDFANFTSEEYSRFIDLIINIIQIPSKEVRDYMALLCNGYFTYNILGHDKEAREKRLDVLKNKKIFIDSSILISLLAKSCQTNKFTIDLITKLKKYNNNFFITEKLYTELYNHAYWAIKNFSNTQMNNLNLYQAFIGVGGYKQNLFIDGACNYSKETGIQMMDSYFSECLGEDYETDLKKCIDSKLTDFGIKILIRDENIDISNAILQEDYKNKIKELRINKESYRSDFQCETEAELVTLAQDESFAFITQTTNLKEIDSKKNILNWSPEGLYRFLEMNDCSIDLDNLYNCMVSDIYNGGFCIINKETMTHISEKFYQQADLKLKEIQKLNNKNISKYLEKDLINRSKADGTYPFYVMQVQEQLSQILVKQTENLQNKTEQLERSQKGNALTQKEKIRLERFENKRKQKLDKEKNKRKNKKHKKGKK